MCFLKLTVRKTSDYYLKLPWGWILIEPRCSWILPTDSQITLKNIELQNIQSKNRPKLDAENVIVDFALWHKKESKGIWKIYIGNKTKRWHIHLQKESERKQIRIKEI